MTVSPSFRTTPLLRILKKAPTLPRFRSPLRTTSGAPLELDQNAQWLKASRQKIITLADEAEQAREYAEAYAKHARRLDIKADLHRNAADLARDDLAPLTREDGSLKGIHVRLGRFEWRSRKREQAEELKGEVSLHEHYRQDARREADRHLEDAEKFAETSRARADLAEIPPARPQRDGFDLWRDFNHR